MNQHTNRREGIIVENDSAFVDGPRIFVLARSALSGTIDEFYDHFGLPSEEKESAKFAAEKIVETAGRVCYLSFANPAGKSTQAYIEHLIRQGHESVLEHVSWTFVLTGVSRAFTHQLVRHRVGFAYSQLSQQYVDHRSIRFVIPTEIISNSTLLSRWKRAVLSQREQYVHLIDKLETSESDFCPREKHRSSRSAARSVLPNCIEAIIAVTGNARAWRHFLDLRGSTEGDLEMRRVSALLLSALKKEAPSMFFDFRQEKFDDGWPIVRKFCASENS